MSVRPLVDIDPEFRVIHPGERDRTARVLTEAFAGDVGLRTQVELEPEQMMRFWGIQVDLFLAPTRSPRWARIFGGFVHGGLEAAVVVYEEGWTPDPDALTEHLTAYRRAFGLKAMTRYLQFSHEYQLATRPETPCLRLQSFGCAERSRGQGLGTQFLEHIHRLGRGAGHRAIQLEVQYTSPARSLYARHDYRHVKPIEVGGVEMELLVRWL